MAQEKKGPVLVALGYDSLGPDLIRAGSALARESGSALECLTIDTGARASPEEGERLAEAQRLARSLGASVTSAPAIDVAEGLAKSARGHGVSALVTGMGRSRILGTGFLGRLRSAEREFSIIAIAGPSGSGDGSRRRRSAAPFEDLAGQYTAAIVIIAAVTGINLALAAYAGYWAAAITYLAAISLSALFFDRWPVFLAALLSAVAWDFLFIPPRFTMFISRTEDVLMLVLYLLVALCSGWLTGRLRASERLLAARESRMSLLSALASKLAGAKTLGVILDAGVEAIKDAFTVEAIAILREGEGGLRHQAESGWEPLDASARDAAQASFEGMRGAGRFTELYPKSEWHFVPMEGPAGCLGVLGLRAAHDASWSEELESFLRTMALTVSSAVARAMP